MVSDEIYPVSIRSGDDYAIKVFTNKQLADKYIYHWTRSTGP